MMFYRWTLTKTLLSCGWLCLNAIPALGSTSLADRIFVDYSVSPDSITVGDDVTVELRVQAPPGWDVSFPSSLNGQGGKFDLIAKHEEVPVADSTASASGLPLLWKARYQLAMYAVGKLVLPPWSFQVRSSTQNETVVTDSIRIEVQSLLADSLAQTSMQDLPPPAELRVPWSWWAKAGIVAAAVLGLAIWLWSRRRRHYEQPIHMAPVRPADEIALEALRLLEGRRLPFDNKVKKHYVELSEILRRYLEDSSTFRIPALEQTTDEIIEDLLEGSFDDQIVTRVRSLSAESDLVKFAKHQPSAEESMDALTRVRQFVQDTSKAPVLAEGSAAS